MHSRMARVGVLGLVGVIAWHRFIPDAPGQSDTITAIPEVIRRGFASYHSVNVRNAVQNWTRNGVLAGTEGNQAIIKSFERFEKAFGGFRDYEVLGQLALRNAVRVVYLVIEMDGGPVFARFQLFLRKGRWSVIDIQLDEKPEEILPHLILERHHLPVVTPAERVEAPSNSE